MKLKIIMVALVLLGMFGFSEILWANATSDAYYKVKMAGEKGATEGICNAAKSAAAAEGVPIPGPVMDICKKFLGKAIEETVKGFEVAGCHMIPKAQCGNHAKYMKHRHVCGKKLGGECLTYFRQKHLGRDDDGMCVDPPCENVGSGGVFNTNTGDQVEAKKRQSMGDKKWKAQKSKPTQTAEEFDQDMIKGLSEGQERCLPLVGCYKNVGGKGVKTR